MGKNVQMTETEYRISRIHDKAEAFRGKKVALYGTGDNAKYVLDEVKEIAVEALIDQNGVGQYKFGRLVISLNQALLLGIEVIIIAAEARSSVVVSERIAEFCLEHKIQLYNLYGMDELARKRELLEQKANYLAYSVEQFEAELEAHDVVCIQMRGFLCEDVFIDENDLLEEIATKSGVHDFAENRIKAEEGYKAGRVPYGIEEIYDVYQTATFASEESVFELMGMEEQARMASCAPYSKVIEIVNRMVEKGKKVFLFSDYKLSRRSMFQLLNRLGLDNRCELIQENIYHHTVSNGLLRIGLQECLEKKAAFFGEAESDVMMLAHAYGMKTCALQSAWNVYLQSLGNASAISKEQMLAYKGVLRKQKEIPFLLENRMANLTNKELDELSNWKEKNREELKKLLLADIIDCTIDKLERLQFPVFENPEVSIVIPAHNHLDYTYNCLKSILLNTRAVSYEIIVGDDLSSDDTKRLDEVVEGITIFHNEKNLQFLRTCNKAAGMAKGKYILFLNNDTQVMYNWLLPLVKLMEENPNIGMTGSKLIFSNGMLQEAGGIIWNDGSAHNYGRGDNYTLSQYNYVKEVDYITGAAIMIRGDLWREIGGFDERYAPVYYEDADLALEVRKHGYQVVYQPESVVVHFEGITNGTDVTSGAKKHQTENWKKFCEKWKEVLKSEHVSKTEGCFAARERKLNKKTVLICSDRIPEYDRDAGSRSIYLYIKLLQEKGYLVKLVAGSFYADKKYRFQYQQMGVEVLEGAYWKNHFEQWIAENHSGIEFAWLIYPRCGEQFVNLMKYHGIKVCYYGIDLHYVRNRREYDLTGDESKKRLSEEMYQIEKEVIEKSDVCYYPSEEEVETIKKEFSPKKVKSFPILYYEMEKQNREYIPDKREGMMFIGGFGHPPNVDAMQWFTKEIYPKIRAKKEIDFYLVGSNPNKEIVDINLPGIHNLGFVSEKALRELYDKIRMVVIPLRFGAGVKGKVLDALYYNVPMVSTSIGIEGIPDAEKTVVHTDAAEEFAKKVLELYDDSERLAATSVAYRELIQKHYSKEAIWDNIKEDFE